MRLNNARLWALLPLRDLAGIFVGLVLAAVGGSRQSQGGAACLIGMAFLGVSARPDQRDASFPHS
jgi:hypothetical protein